MAFDATTLATNLFNTWFSALSILEKATVTLTNQTALKAQITVGLQSAYNQGYTDGQAAGDAAGYTRGYSAGQTAGYTSGQTAGYSTGYSAGQTAGDSTGYTRGYNQGTADQVAATPSFASQVDAHFPTERQIRFNCTGNGGLRPTDWHPSTVWLRAYLKSS